MRHEFFCGLDLGQSQDYTALVILERVKIPVGEVNADLVRAVREELHCRHVERLPLGTSYPAIVSHVKALVESPALKGHVTLAVDHTGCGRPVFDMLADALDCSLYGITITGGDTVTWDGRNVRCPKRDLVGSVQVHLQNSTLKIAASLPDADLLTKELLNFKIRIDPLTSHDSYSAWREGMHDDLVLATAMAVWMADQVQPIRFIRMSV
jgi:hypothetical protein